MTPRPVAPPVTWPFPETYPRGYVPAPEVWFKQLEVIRTARQAALDAALKGNFTRAADHAARIEAAARELAVILIQQDPTTEE